MEKENEKKESLEPLDIDKQLWLAKQKELSELEIIKRKKKRNWYKTKGRIILVIFIIVMIIMNRCEVQVENQNSEQKIAAYQEKNFLYLNNQNIGGGGIKMFELLKMPIWEILLLLFVLVVLFNVVAKLLVDFILKILGGKKK